MREDSSGTAPGKSGDPPSSPALTRRQALGGGAAALVTALAGCSSLPFGDDEEPELGFDPAEFPQSIVSDLPERPSAYPGPVPDQLFDHHRERARALLDEVPTDPSFPNERISERIDRDQDSASRQLRDGPDAEPTRLDQLGNWRYIRGTVAEVWGAYNAAAGDVDAATLESRREEIRRDLASFESEWASPGADGVEAIAVNNQLEQLRTACRRSLSPRWSFPENPTAAVFRVGSLVTDIERARAQLDDLIGLHDAYLESDASVTTGYRTELSVLAHRLEATVAMSRPQVAPYLENNVGPDDFDRDIEQLPAERLFIRLHGPARRGLEDVEEARHRGNEAQAVVHSGQALVAILALSTAIDAIRDGKYGMPDSIQAVKDARETALDALDRTRSLEPTLLAKLFAIPAWEGVDEHSYTVSQFTEREEEPDQRDVVELVAAFAATTHLARAVPEVVDRVERELEDVVG